MKQFEIVAHRGIATEAPENTIAAFQRAVELGADAVELDVRLTADKIPVVYHYFYLHENASTSGAIFNFTLAQLQNVKVYCKNNPAVEPGNISTLAEILDIFGGKIGLEIEIKGPEPEAPMLIANVLNNFKKVWDKIEMTSFEPALLLAFSKDCPGLPVDLLFPPSENWMKLDVVLYQAVQYSRLAHARAVHLHPTQLSKTVVTTLRQQGIEIHVWDVNDQPSLKICTEFDIPRLCTDDFKQAHAFRENMFKHRAAG
jgi:glycerophosphoryl diester phosphodiesterase